MNASLSVNLHESTVGNVPTSTASTSPGSGNRGPDTSLILGVTIGGVIGLILINVFITKLMKREEEKKKREEEKEEEEKEEREEREEREELRGQSVTEGETGHLSVPQRPNNPSPPSSTHSQITTGSMSMQTACSL